jgi:ferritin-like metal-binding protein YciE
MNITGFKEMYISELQEAHAVEAMLTKALPVLAKSASTHRLKDAFNTHLKKTEEHKQKVQELLDRHKARRDSHTDRSMKGMIAETERMCGMVEEGPLRDAAMIASAQRIEHYEIAVYGTLATYAKFLGLDEDKQTLGSILQEEKAADEMLSQIADQQVNARAASA